LLRTDNGIAASLARPPLLLLPGRTRSQTTLRLVGQTFTDQRRTELLD
jgi:hypothetical protein